jgi:hypothetical protein
MQISNLDFFKKKLYVFTYFILEIIFPYQKQMIFIYVNTSCKYNLFLSNMQGEKLKINYNNLFEIL